MDTADAFYNIPFTDAFAQYEEQAEAAGQRTASLDNTHTFASTAKLLFAAEGVTMTGQITLIVLNRVVTAYKRRINRAGEQNSDSSARSFSIRLKTWCGWSYQMRFLRADHFFNFKLHRADEDADIPVWDISQLDLGVECIHAHWDPLRHPEIATTWSRQEANVLETRAIAWFGLALSTGARRGEMCQLRKSDINREAMLIKFPAKSTKSRRKRELPLSPRVLADLDAMDEARAALAAIRPKRRGPKPVVVATDGRKPPKPKPKGDWLFRNSWGEQIDGPSVLHQLKRYFEWGRTHGMPLPERFTLHGLRHKAISAALQVNPEHAHSLAGHASVLTTQKIYGHTTTDDVRQTHEQTDVYERVMSKSQPAPDLVPEPAPEPVPVLTPRRPSRQRTY